MATNTRFATGMHTLILLARQPDQLHSSETLAAKLQTNAVVIRRILAQLQQAELVRNHKGPSGGSELVRPAAEITMGDVYRATDSSALFQEGSPKAGEAKKASGELRRALDDAQKAMLASLDSVTLQQIVRRSGRK